MRFIKFIQILSVILLYASGYAAGAEVVEVKVASPVPTTLKTAQEARMVVAPFFGGELLSYQLSGHLSGQPSGQIFGQHGFSSAKSEAVASPLVGRLTTPLGSLWKLFIYSYLVESGSRPPRYICTGTNPEEVFCCTPKHAIDLEDALAKSCSPYFKPQRLEIDKGEWNKFWLTKSAKFPSWILSLENLSGEARVPVEELLRSLNLIRDTFSRAIEIRRALTRVLIMGTGEGSIRQYGSLLAVKTFTWRDAIVEKNNEPLDKFGFTGGFAGWLQDGSSVWFSGAGHGRELLQSWWKDIGFVAREHAIDRSTECVQVQFFDQYAIRKVLNLDTGKSAEVGTLHGKFAVVFKNGHRLEFHGDGSVELIQKMNRSGKTLEIKGLFTANNYIARVLGREAANRPHSAAAALSVAIRTFLIQNGKLKVQQGNRCYSIEDSTHAQRVSIENPSAEALAIAIWTDGLVLDGVPNIRYHSTVPGPNRLAWTQAKELSLQGFSFDEILHHAYPTGQLSVDGFLKDRSCVALAAAEKWLIDIQPRWYPRIAHIAGFETPGALRVCRSRSTHAYADFEHKDIYLPSFDTGEDRISLTHEYLHMAFSHHPSGQDEGFIENLALELNRPVSEELQW